MRLPMAMMICAACAAAWLGCEADQADAPPAATDETAPGVEVERAPAEPPAPEPVEVLFDAPALVDLPRDQVLARLGGEFECTTKGGHVESCRREGPRRMAVRFVGPEREFGGLTTSLIDDVDAETLERLGFADAGEPDRADGRNSKTWHNLKGYDEVRIFRVAEHSVVVDLSTRPVVLTGE